MATTNHTTSGTKRRFVDDDGAPYARYAFWNPYNISLFLGGVVLGVATGHEWISVLTCAAEVLWMIFAPDSKILRALWFDRALRGREEGERRRSPPGSDRAPRRERQHALRPTFAGRSR